MSHGTDAWRPRQRFALVDVLLAGNLGGLCVGDPSDRVEALLGPPQAPAGRLSKRSKLWSHGYGNVAVLTAARRVASVEIDFEGQRAAMVEAGALAGWSLDEWRAFAGPAGFVEEARGEIVVLRSASARVVLDAGGALHLARLT